MNIFFKSLFLALTFIPFASNSMELPDHSRSNTPLEEIQGVAITSNLADIFDGIMGNAKKNHKKSCLICLEERPLGAFYTLHCNHSYCLSCLRCIANLAIKEKTSSYLVCPDPLCMEKFDISDIKAIYPELEIHENIIKMLKIESDMKNPKFKHCPVVNCEGYFINIYGVGKIISCSECHASYCSNCLKSHKQNLSCEKAAALLLGHYLKDKDHKEKEEKAYQEELFKKWKNKNTKNCPGCGTTIQKNGGCQKMKCGKCGCRFQWNPQQ
jgi:E3 ubiquitin-protein ligase RNF14